MTRTRAQLIEFCGMSAWSSQNYTDRWLDLRTARMAALRILRELERADEWTAAQGERAANLLADAAESLEALDNG